MKSFKNSIFLIVIVFFCSCKQDSNQNQVNQQSENQEQIITKDSTQTLLDTTTTAPVVKEEIEVREEEYKLDSTLFFQVYKKKINAPALDLNQNIHGKTISDLVMLKNQLLARKGYFFSDHYARNYFQKLKWYQPIFWDSKYYISFTEEEKAFVEKIEKEIANLSKKNSTIVENTRKINFNNIYNLNQISVSDELRNTIQKKGLAFSHSPHKQLFQIYKENYKENIPSFVTVDLFSQLMLLMLEKIHIEMEEMSFDNIVEILKHLHKESDHFAFHSNGNDLLKRAAKINAVFYAVPLFFLTGERVPVPNDYLNYYQEEIDKITASARIDPSLFLDAALFDYTRFKPHGHYLDSEKLKKYFLAVTWLGEAPLTFSKEDQLAAALLTAHLLNSGTLSNGKSIRDTYLGLFESMSTIQGSVEELGLPDLMDYLGQKNPYELLTPSVISDVKTKLSRGNTKQRINILPKRNSIERDILTTLTNEKTRVLPKALDVFVVLNNPIAEHLIHHYYNVTKSLSNYDVKIEDLKIKYNQSWTKTAYGTWLSAFSALTSQNQLPYFLQTQSWQIKNLHSALSMFVDMNVTADIEEPLTKGYGLCPKRDTIREGRVLGYVEPKVDYWKTCILVMQKIRAILGKSELMSEGMKNYTNQIIEMAQFFKTVSEKELKKVSLTDLEHKRINEIGFQIEKLFFASNRHQVESNLSSIITLYSGKSNVLQEAVGNPYYLYTVVEIDGWLYFSRGALLSYYEIEKGNYGKLTPSEWREKVRNREVNVPDWFKELFVPEESLKIKQEFKRGC